MECTDRKQKEVMEYKMRYVGGLKELEYATEQVSQMKEDLFKLKPELQKAQKDTEEMMNMISFETIQVEIATARVQEDEKIANVQAEAANKLKTECEDDLALAKPAFEGNQSITTLAKTKTHMFHNRHFYSISKQIFTDNIKINTICCTV